MKRIIKFSLVTIATTLLALVAWIAITVMQPSLFAQPSSVKPTSVGNMPERLQRHITTIVNDFFPRDHTSIARLNQTAAYIESELKQYSDNVVFQPFEVQGKRYKNVIATFGPDTKDIIIIGTHYDSYDTLPAADDNASGVAGLIELAVMLKGAKLNQRVELVAYTLEEPPYFRTPDMGSAVHARSVKAGGKRVSLMLSLECIGYFSDAPNSQEFPIAALKAFYPTTGNFIALVGHYNDGALAKRVRETMKSATPLPVYSINAPSIVTGIDFSDHLNYWNEGFVGMMVTDTAFMRNKNYHTEHDTAEKLDYVRIAQVVQAVAKVVMTEANQHAM